MGGAGGIKAGVNGGGGGIKSGSNGGRKLLGQLPTARRWLGGAPVSLREPRAGAPTFDFEYGDFFTFQTQQELTPCDQGRRCECFLLPLF